MMYRIVRSELQAIVCATLVATLLSSCAALSTLTGKVNVERPAVSFAGAKLAGLSFDAADLMFDLKISNPNSLGIKMAGFDYDFLVNENSFLKGNREEEIEIKAGGESMIQFPLSLNFADLYQTFQDVRGGDVSTYQLNCGFSFTIPVLGVVRVPVSKAGEFPLLKLPTVNLDAIKLKRLSITGAELQLIVKLNNPNAFSMLLDHLQYQLEVDGTNWVSGNAEQETHIAEKGESFVSIPVSLNFVEIGRAVAYQTLTGDRDLGYKFGGELGLATSIPLLGRVTLPFDRSGEVGVSK